MENTRVCSLEGNRKRKCRKDGKVRKLPINGLQETIMVRNN